MSRASIRAIDLFCDVLNGDEEVKAAYPDEVEARTAKRDRDLQRFRKTISKVTQEEFLRGRWGIVSVERRIRQWDEMIARAAS